MMPSKLDAAAALESMDSMDALQSKPLTTVPDEMRPAFDYSGLDAQTVDDLHFAEKEYQHGKKLAAQLGKNPKYISQVLNGHYEPKKAEREFNAALSAIIEGRQEKED